MFDENDEDVDNNEVVASSDDANKEELDTKPSDDENIEMSADSDSSDEDSIEAANNESDEDLSDTELAAFESEEVEDLEYVDDTQALSIIESVLFATDKPQGMSAFRQVFKGTVINKAKIKKLLDELTIDYAGGHRGITLEETTGGYQLRTKSDNMAFIKRMIKGRTFKLSGPALEVLSIVAYKQPCIKSQVDEIRGVESGHLLRGLMDRGLVGFGGKSELPGKPMFYQTSRKFLEIFGLRNLNELPTLSEIDELLPDGIDEDNEDNETLDQITSSLSKEALETYSESEEELGKITDQLVNISTSSDFFEQEKIRVKKEKDAHRAQDIEDALTVGEEVPKKDINWLEKYKTKLAEESAAVENSEDDEPKDVQAAGVADNETTEVSSEDIELSELATAGSVDEPANENIEPEETLSDVAEVVTQDTDDSGVSDLDFALSDHDFEGDDEVLTPAAEDESLDVKADEEKKPESKIGEVSITDLKNDIDALS